MRYTIFFLASIIIIACNKKTETVVEEETEETSVQQCYLYSNNKDTVQLTLTTKNTNVDGDLSYNIFEKDRNVGTIHGVVSGDTIIAEYTFNSEGIQSVREVIFLKKGSSLTEAIGNLDSTGLRFSNRRELSFSGFELIEKDCN